MKIVSCLAIGAALTVGSMLSAEEWIELFDGESLAGWSAPENAATWSVRDGALVAEGERSHLFYVGEEPGTPPVFRNFILEAEVMTEPGANSGIYFHTAVQPQGWPERGYEAQILNSNPRTPEGAYVEHKMSGSLYGIRNVWKAPAVDDTWFRYRIEVRGKTVRTFIDERPIAAYTEPSDPFRPDGHSNRLLGGGTFALQGHDPGSVVHFRKLRLQPLADDLESPGEALIREPLSRLLIVFAAENIPLLDLAVPAENLRIGSILRQARAYGITPGVVGTNRTPLPELPPEVYGGLHIREAGELPGTTADAPFPYAYVRADGRPLQYSAGSPAAYGEAAITHIEALAATGRVQVIGHLAWLPQDLQGSAPEVWPRERQQTLLRLLSEHGIALELNATEALPSPGFLRRAQEAGVRFSFGGLLAASPESLESLLERVRQSGLGWQDFWVPKHLSEE